MLYIYTEKGEAKAKELGFTDRKAGQVAFCGMEQPFEVKFRD